MPELGYPDSLPAGARFRDQGKRWKFCGTANLLFMGEDPVYTGMAVPLDGPGNPKRRMIRAQDVDEPT